VILLSFDTKPIKEGFMSRNEWIKGPRPLSEVLPNTNKRFKQKTARAFISDNAQALGLPDPYEHPIE